MRGCSEDPKLTGEWLCVNMHLYHGWHIAWFCTALLLAGASRHYCNTNILEE